MVDVSGKTSPPAPPPRPAGSSRRRRSSTCCARDGLPKGDALAVARIAGIAGGQAHAGSDPAVPPDRAARRRRRSRRWTDDAVEITATTRTADRTGVEMEALTAVVVAGLALYDMVKAVDRSARLTDVRLLAKDGGRSGTWTRRRSRPIRPGRPREGRRDHLLEPLGRRRARRRLRWAARRPADRGRAQRSCFAAIVPDDVDADPGRGARRDGRRRRGGVDHGRHRAHPDRRHARGGRPAARPRDPGHRRGVAAGRRATRCPRRCCPAAWPARSGRRWSSRCPGRRAACATGWRCWRRSWSTPSISCAGGDHRPGGGV